MGLEDAQVGWCLHKHRSVGPIQYLDNEEIVMSEWQFNLTNVARPGATTQYVRLITLLQIQRFC